ncbi:MAG: hypothetical protein ACYTBS_24735 [Planctomycetota bacterium]|jgi:hypothetical protein
MNITKKSDGEEAHEAAAREGDRIQKKIRQLESVGRFSEAESLQSDWEKADLESETWGECYLKLSEL